MRTTKKSIKRRQTMQTFVLCALIAILVFSSAVMIQAKTDNKVHSTKYYTSVEIQPGDTLSSIAAEYMTVEYKNLDEYVKEIKSTNGLKSSEIHAGQHLTIPYYSYAEL